MSSIFEDPMLFQPQASSVLQNPGQQAPGVGLAPPESSPGIGVAPAPDQGIGMAPQAAPQSAQAPAGPAPRSTMDRTMDALSAFGAGVLGRPQPMMEQAKADREARMAQITELKETSGALKQGVDMMEGLTGPERATFAETYGKRLDGISPGLGTTFKALSDRPGMLEAISANGQYLPDWYKTLTKTNPKEALRIAGTPEGQKMLTTAVEIPVMNSAVQKGQFLVAHWQQVAPELVPELGDKPNLDSGDLLRINNAVAADPKYKALALTPYELSTAQADHHADAFYSALHVLSPKNAQAALAVTSAEGSRPQTEVAKARVDLKAGRIDQSEYDSIVAKATHVPPDPDKTTSFQREAAALYGEGTPEYKAALKAHVARADAPTQVMVNAGQPAGANANIQADAASVASGMPISQVAPGYGQQAVKYRQQLRAAAIEQIKTETGVSDAEAGRELAMRSIDFSAGRQSIGQLTKMQGATVQAVKQLDFNIDKTTEEMKKLKSTDLSPILNAIVRGEERWTGDPAYASTFYYLSGAAMESARIRSGGQASAAQLHQGAAEEAKQWANINMTPASWKSVAEAMKAEGQAKLGTYKDAISGQRNPGKAPAATSGGLPAGWSVTVH